jgi:hypothetical protein
VPLIAAAVCPHPPLLVPELAGAAAPELDALRAACDEAVDQLLRPADRDAGGAGDAGPDLLVVVGADAVTRRYGADAAGGFQPYGLELTVGAGEPVLPLSLTIGRWLLARRSAAGAPRAGAGLRFQGVAENAPPAECLRLGAELAASAERVALLILGDGSACRGDLSPGYRDDRAEPYDAAVAQALGSADAAALAGLDPTLSRELLAAGRAAWQVLAGATGRTALKGTLLADQAPYGVGYFVAGWTR